MRQHDVMDIPVGAVSILGRDIVKSLADMIEPIRLQKIYKLTLMDGEQRGEGLTLSDYDLLMNIFGKEINLLIDDVSQRKLQKLKHFGIRKGYRALYGSHLTGEESWMFRGVPCIKNELQTILQLPFDMTFQQLKFIALLREMKKKQWPHFQKIFDNAQSKPEWNLKANFADEDKVWRRRRLMIEESKLREVNISFVHGELLGVLTAEGNTASQVEDNSVIPIEVARDYMARHGVMLRENSQVQNEQHSGEGTENAALQEATQDAMPQLREIVQVEPWIENSKKIHKELLPGIEHLSNEKKAYKVHEEMKRRHEKGDKGMTKRGGKKCPSPGSILRRGL